jgi:hypothetical protein
MGFQCYLLDGHLFPPLDVDPQFIQDLAGTEVLYI